MSVCRRARDLGLAVLVVAAASFVQLAGQVPSRRFIAEDLIGNFSPGIPPGAEWPIPNVAFLAPRSLAVGADGNILFTSSVLNWFGQFRSVPNNTTGQSGVTRFNPVGPADEVRSPGMIVEGACWSGSGQCQFVTDQRTCSIYERTPGSGAIQRVVGTGQCWSPNDVPAPLVNGVHRLDARFHEITALGWTSAEGLLFGSCGAGRNAIYRAVPGMDTIEYLAGTGELGSFTPGPATAAHIPCPNGPIIPALVPLQDETQVNGVAVAFPDANQVGRITSGGMLEVLAGNGSPGSSGDSGPAASGQLQDPRCVVRHKAAYEICDAGNFRIRRVDNLSGLITTAVGNGSPGLPAPGAPANASVGEVETIAFDPAGNRYIVNGNIAVVGVYGAATATYSLLFPVPPYPTFGDSTPGNETPLRGVTGIARIDGPAGLEGLLFAEAFSFLVRRWDAATNRVTTFAGGGPFPINGSTGDGIPANQSFVILPWDVVRAPDGNTYIGELGCRIRKVDTAGIITTAVGNGLCTSTGDDGPAVNATTAVFGLAAAPDGRIFWSDPISNTIRQLATNGTVSRVAGNGTPGFSGDGGPALEAQLVPLGDIDISADGRFLFVSDYGNSAIRAIDLSLDPPRIATVAGIGLQPGNSGDGGPANQAKLSLPEGVSVSGNTLAIADRGNERIRMVTFPANASSLEALGNGVITTIFGTGVPGRMGRGVADAVNARVQAPLGLAPLPGNERGWFYSEQEGLTVGKLIEQGAPNAAADFSANVSGNFVFMKWTPPDSGAPATSYRVLARLTAGGPVIAQLDVTEPSLIVDGVPNGTYVVSVRGSNRFGDGPESSQRTITVPQAYIASGAPRNLSSSVLGATVTLRWQPPATGGPPTQYIVAPAQTPGGPPITLIPIGAVADVAADGTQSLVTSFTATGVPLGTYYVRLHGVNPANTGLSAPSNEVTVVVAPPNAPVMNAPAKIGSTVTFTWTPAAGPVAQSYLLTAAASPGGPTIASVTTTAPAFTATAVPAGTYYVRVRAVSTAGQSGPSNEVAVTVP